MMNIRFSDIILVLPKLLQKTIYFSLNRDGLVFINRVIIDFT